MTHTTNPLLSADTIRKMLEKYVEAVSAGKADSLFTVTRHQVRFYTPEGAPINHDPENLLRTQDLPPYLEENSVGYVFGSESFARTGARIGRHPVMFETPAVESIDIDEPADWYIAETLLQRIATGRIPPRSVETL
jgi:CMP-N-acetylneuraminic acid synthetase